MTTSGMEGSARFLRDLDHFPPVYRWRVVLVQKGQAAREGRRLLGRLQPMPGRRPGRARHHCNRASSQPSGSGRRHQTPRSRRPGRHARRPSGRRRIRDTADMAEPE
eukprot:scaffold47189_cov73-Phaeocystis_antarctica.AAC.4